MSASDRSFLKEIAGKVRAAYRLPERLARQNLETKVGLKLTAEGALDSVRVEKSSGSEEFDRLVLDALKSVEPLAPPPESVVGREIIVVFRP